MARDGCPDLMWHRSAAMLCHIRLVTWLIVAGGSLWILSFLARCKWCQGDLLGLSKHYLIDFYGFRWIVLGLKPRGALYMAWAPKLYCFTLGKAQWSIVLPRARPQGLVISPLAKLQRLIISLRAQQQWSIISHRVKSLGSIISTQARSYRSIVSHWIRPQRSNVSPWQDPQGSIISP